MKLPVVAPGNIFGWSGGSKLVQDSYGGAKVKAAEMKGERATRSWPRSLRPVPLAEPEARRLPGCRPRPVTGDNQSEVHSQTLPQARPPLGAPSNGYGLFDRTVPRPEEPITRPDASYDQGAPSEQFPRKVIETSTAHLRFSQVRRATRDDDLRRAR